MIAAVILAVGIVAGGYLLGDGLKRAHLADRAVTMRGLAERNVTADLATWTISFTAQGTELDAVRAESDQDAATVLNFLRRAGFPAQAVTDGGGSVNQFYDTNRGANQVTVNRRIQLRTNDVMRARQAYARQFELIRGGVALQEGSSVQYSFTQLNTVKPDMIAQATQDARRAAEQFARDSGTGVGGIRSATQGYFSIGARDGDSTGEGGGGGGDSPFQKVRVVTTIEFYLN
ncbi:MAG TPA: SIMPL domain-containing protein [Allosphingosinicella sp.]|nr:SIMPL domain-containing protein [Allosphingosinicella sp.]